MLGVGEASFDMYLQYDFGVLRLHASCPVLSCIVCSYSNPLTTGSAESQTWHSCGLSGMQKRQVLRVLDPKFLPSDHWPHPMNIPSILVPRPQLRPTAPARTTRPIVSSHIFTQEETETRLPLRRAPPLSASVANLLPDDRGRADV